MKHTKQRIKRNAMRTVIKPLALFTLLGISVGAQAIESPFAFIPLHLQTTTTSTTGVGAKPNILIQFDDSGSMKYSTTLDVSPGSKYLQVDGVKEVFINRGKWVETALQRLYPGRRITGGIAPNIPASQTRIEIAKAALKKLTANPDIWNSANWGLISLWDNGFNPDARKLPQAGQGLYGYAQDVYHGRRQFAMSQSEFNGFVNKLTANAATPTAERFLDSMSLLQKAMKYRCQKNYIIVFSDGDAQSYFNLPTVTSNTFNTKFKYPNQYFEQSGQAKRTDAFVDNGLNINTYHVWLADKDNKTYPLPSDEVMAKYLNSPNKTAQERLLEQILLDGITKQSLANEIRIRNQKPITPLFTKKANGSYQWNLYANTVDTSKYKLPMGSVNNPTVGNDVESAWPHHADVAPFLADLANQDLKKEGVDGTDAAGQSWDDPAFPTQKIGTFTIGFGAGLSERGLTSLSKMATANKNVVLNASNQQELDAAFTNIIQQITSENIQIPPKSVATVSPSVNYDSKAPDTLNSASTIHLDLATGSSELRFYNLQKSGSGQNYLVDNTKFSMPDYSNRKTIITTGLGKSQAYWFDATNSSLPFTNADFAIDNGRDEQEWKNALLPWFTRSKPDAEIAGMTTNHMKYRIRSTSEPDARSLGDVLDSSLTATGLSTDYRYGRQRYLVTAANDGMVYLFESKNDDTHPYELKLNYMPSSMQRESDTDLVSHYYKNVANANYILGANGVNPHHYLLNGDFTVRVTDNSARQRIFMSGNMGQAGRGSYSLNIGGTKRSDGTPVGLEASDWLTSVPLFETEKSTNNPMGYTIGAPQIGRIAPERTLEFSGTDVKATANVRKLYYATFVNSGVRNPIAKNNTESALYVYSTLGGENVGLQATTSPADDSAFYAQGKLVSKLNAGNNGGLAQATIVDNDFDGAVDVAYAGDFKGNLYRFDLRGAVNQWKVTRIFTTINNRPITAAPAVVRNDKNHYVVVFGTGSDLYQTDLNNKDTQSVYGIYDDLTQDNPTPVTSGELLQQTLTAPRLRGDYNQRDLSKLTFDKNQHRGWFFNLSEGTGERVVVKPSTLLKTIVLTTRQYSVNTTANHNNNTAADVCVPSSEISSTTASSWLMQFRSDTGGKLPEEGEKDADLFGYIDVTGGNSTNSYKKRATESLIAGFQYANGGLLSYTLIGGGRDASKIGDQGNAYSLFGDVGTGEDIKPTEGGKEPSICWNTSANSGQLLSSNSTDTKLGLNETKEVYAKQCNVASLKRISWREIF